MGIAHSLPKYERIGLSEPVRQRRKKDENIKKKSPRRKKSTKRKVRKTPRKTSPIKRTKKKRRR